MDNLKRPTVRQIAKLAGVSATAVSLALRNHPSISEATRKRIKEIAERLHYRPDPMLSRLAAYRHGLQGAVAPARIAYLINWLSYETWRKEHCEMRFFAGAKQHAEQLGYQLDEVWTHRPNIKRRRLMEILTTRNYDGLLVSDSPQARGHLALDWSKFCAVKIGHSLVYPRLPCVENNQFQIIQLAIRELRRKGYRRIGLALRASLDEKANHWYLASYATETSRPRLFEHVQPLITKNWNEETFKKWFMRYQPEVVLSLHLRVWRWLFAGLGLRIPEEVGFVDLDCADRSGVRAGIYQYHEQVGAVAMDTLVQLMQRNERGLPQVPRLTLLEGTWIDGQTVQVKKRQKTYHKRQVRR
jgi:LacI family transcriptional regulator